MSTYALSTFLLRDWAREEAIAMIATSGFRELELATEDGHWGNWVDEPTVLRKQLQAAGLVARTVHSPSAGWNNGAPDPALRQASVEAVAASFRQAAEVGAEIVIVHANGANSEYTEAKFRENWARSRQSLSVLAQRAQEAGVKMALENLPRRGLPRPGGSVPQVLEFIEGLGDHVGVCLDAGHSNANGLSAAQEALAAGAKLLALHIQDNDGSGEDQHVLPGRGTTDWDAFLDALTELGFAGPRTFDVTKGDTPQALLTALAALRDDWAGRWP